MTSLSIHELYILQIHSYTPTVSALSLTLTSFFLLFFFVSNMRMAQLSKYQFKNPKNVFFLIEY